MEEGEKVRGREEGREGKGDRKRKGKREMGRRREKD